MAKLNRLGLVVVTAAAVASCGVLLSGCAGDIQGQTQSTAARITALSATDLAVGDEVHLSGENFVTSDKGWVDVAFVGNFTPSDGSEVQQVNITIPLQASDDGTLKWSRFGAFRVPFGSGDRIGAFQGKILATNRYYTGETIQPPSDHAFPASITVKPSLVLIDMRAVGDSWIADCRYPVTTAINLVPYLIRIRAVGFEPSQFDYTFSEGLFQDGMATTGATRLSRPMLEAEHAMVVQFAEVPENVDGFSTSISLQATATDGGTYLLQLPVMVRRPLQVYYNTPMQIAEVYPPEPVSGCIPGGQVGISVTYSESHSETRTRSIQNTELTGWDKTYGQQFTDTYGTADTATTDQTTSTVGTVTDARSMMTTDTNTFSSSATQSREHTNHIDYTQTNESSYDWSVNHEDTHNFSKEVGGGASGGFKPFGIGVDVKAEGKVGWVDGTVDGNSMGGSQSSSNGVTQGSSDTTGTSITEGQARSQGVAYGISQSYAEANGFSQSNSLANTRSYSDAESRSQALTMQLQTSQSVTETVSTTDEKGLQTQGNIPATQNAMWYRQTTRLIRQGTVVAYDLCGNGSPVGTINIDDWTWAPNLAIGPSCPPPPDLQPAVCVIPPCSNQ